MVCVFYIGLVVVVLLLQIVMVLWFYYCLVDEDFILFRRGLANYRLACLSSLYFPADLFLFFL